MAQTVEVTVAADTLIATTSSSVGTVLPEYKVRDLPLGRPQCDGSGLDDGRRRPDQTATARRLSLPAVALSAVNTTRDGFVVSDGRYDFGAFSTTYTSPDLVEEVRVITAPVDAEAGRGSGQVQMVTRSGTNQFRGSAVLDQPQLGARRAATGSTTSTACQKDYENRNQFGGRLGGPIIKNKTFFFVLVDEQRDVIKQTFVGNGADAAGAAGHLPIFPGADNQNATAEQSRPSIGTAIRSGPQARRRSSVIQRVRPRSASGRDTIRPALFRTRCSRECRCRTITRSATA